MTQTQQAALYGELRSAGQELDRIQAKLQAELDGMSIEDDPTVVAAYKLVSRSIREASVTATSLSQLSLSPA